MKIAVKEVGKELQVIETNEKYRGNCVKQFTGKDDPAEFVRLNEDGSFCIGVNENGLPLQLPLNFLIETTSYHYPIQKMVGTVVFVRCKNADPCIEEIWDYEVEDLREDDIRHIEKILQEQNQKRLFEQFKDYGKGCVFYEPIMDDFWLCVSKN